jgi:cell wall-associated NlpC family hydrolase
MGAWRAGGRYLPHYSVAQYEQSTRSPRATCEPATWCSGDPSSSPSSIYHVALYVGNGRMIHAPRTGRPVTEESMYYWIRRTSTPGPDPSQAVAEIPPTVTSCHQK